MEIKLSDSVRIEATYNRIGPVHLYRVDFVTGEGELARMNHGEYCYETRVLVVAPDHCILAIDNDAIDTSDMIDDPAALFAFDRENPESDETLRAVALAIAQGAEHDGQMNTDVYLYLNETAHGRRFWRVHGDSDVGRLLPPDRTVQVLGPTTLGPDGYETERDAAEALADAAGIDLDEPASWDRGA